MVKKLKKRNQIVIAALALMIVVAGYLSYGGFEEYTAKCVEVDAEDYFREPDKYKGQYIKMTLTVLDSYTEYDCKYGDKYSKLYSCDGGNYAYIIIRDCTQSSRINLKYGDIITIYGEGAGNYTVDGYWNNTSYPCIHVAYVTTIEKTGS